MNLTTLEREVVESVTCDKCGKVITPDDTVEWQELYSIQFTGGYGSVFGDESTIRADFCQQCLKELIGPYYKEEI